MLAKKSKNNYNFRKLNIPANRKENMCSGWFFIQTSSQKDFPRVIDQRIFVRYPKERANL